MRPFWQGNFQNNVLWEVIQGDAMAYYIELFCECPTPVNINGWQFMFEVKESLDPEDPNVLLAVLWTCMGGECGLTALIVIPKLTALLPDGRYAFDLKYRTPSGLVTTVARGQLNVLPTTTLELSFGQEVPPATSSTGSSSAARIYPFSVLSN
jgi:hypothetical protein